MIGIRVPDDSDLRERLQAVCNHLGRETGRRVQYEDLIERWLAMENAMPQNIPHTSAAGGTQTNPTATEARFRAIEARLDILETPPARTWDKDEVIAYITQLMSEGLTLREVSDRLNAEGRPTLSGRGRWQAGTLSKMLPHMPETNTEAE
jgi:hypothetical protein